MNGDVHYHLDCIICGEFMGSATIEIHGLGLPVGWIKDQKCAKCTIEENKKD